MNFKNKKGFITIYTMLAMMFFVLFVVVSAITASRKVQIQTEANTELSKLYKDDSLDSLIIPIYTKAQLLQITNWLDDDDTRQTEYIYVKNNVYKLDKDKYEKYKFTLETDIYLEGKENTDEDDKKIYPYIPNIENFHTIYKEKMNERLDVNKHTVYVVMPSEVVIEIEENIEKREIHYDKPIPYITYQKEISTAEDFLKIEQTGSYILKNNIQLEDKSPINFPFKEFKGIIEGNNKIINGLKIDCEDSFSEVGLFEKNSGIIRNVTFLDVEITNSSGDIKYNNFGIVAGINKGIIENCHVRRGSSTQTIENIINFDFSNFGFICGKNEGIINKSIVSGQKVIVESQSSSNRYIGGIVGEGTNSGIMQTCAFTNSEIENQNDEDYVGGLVGKITGAYAMEDCYMNSVDENNNVLIPQKEKNGIIVSFINTKENVSIEVTYNKILDDWIGWTGEETEFSININGEIKKESGATLNSILKSKFENNNI